VSRILCFRMISSKQKVSSDQRTEGLVPINSTGLIFGAVILAALGG